MAQQVFYRKWRPQSFAEVAGQKHVTQTLLNALKSGHVAHAYLFCGPRGTGKTSTGRILAKAVNCTTSGKGEPCNKCQMCQAVLEDRAMDVIEIDAASNRSIDDVRELRERVNYAPSEARYKVYIIDEFHMLSKDACNALLKTLEEPPPHVIFILATTEAHKVLPTIMSRCQRFDFHRLSQVDVVARLKTVSQAENISIEPQSLQLIARAATGSLRDAENLLEQLTTYYGSEVQFNQVQAMLGITGDYRAKELLKHIITSDVPAGIATVNNVNKDGLDLRQFNRELVEYLRQLLLVKTGSDHAVDLTADDVADLKALSAKASLQHILKAIKLFSQIEPGLDNYSTLPLELALVECSLAPEPERVSAVPRPVSEPFQTTGPAIARAPPVQAKEVKAEPVTYTEPSLKPEPVPIVAQAPAQSVAEKAPVLGTEIERLKTNWRQMLENLPPDIRKSNAIAILRSQVKATAIEGDVVVLSLKSPFIIEKLEKPENKQIAEKVISGFLGRTCCLRCIHEPEKNHLVNEAIKRGAQVTSVEER